MSCELVQSQIVRLERGSVELGMMNGNIESSGVRMMPRSITLEHTMAMPPFSCFEKNTPPTAPSTARIGTSQRTG